MRLYGTLGPSCAKYETLIRMYQAGMTGLRLNLSHGTLAEQANMIGIAASAALAAGVDFDFLTDLKGPEIRIGKLNAPRLLKEGTDVIFGSRGIPVPDILIRHVRPGDRLLIDDGKLMGEVRSVNETQILLHIERGGSLTSNKSITPEGLEIDAPTLTPEDQKNIRAFKQFGVTGVMLPFVRGKEDLITLREALHDAGCDDVRIFAKIENIRGIRMLDEIMLYADEIVIARGDLGDAIPLSKLPSVQAYIAERCREAGRDFMVVTQMLDSMEKNPVPTRAEVTDIYHAVKQGAASLMLTGETAGGKYPVEAMQVLAKTAEDSVCADIRKLLDLGTA